MSVRCVNLVAMLAMLFAAGPAVAGPLGLGSLPVGAASRHDASAALASFGFSASSAAPSRGSWLSNPDVWLWTVGGLAVVGELVASGAKTNFYNAYLGDTTDANFEKALRWEGIRDAMPWIYVPALSIGFGHWGWGKLKGPKDGHAARPAASAPTRTSPPPKPAPPPPAARPPASTIAPIAAPAGAFGAPARTAPVEAPAGSFGSRPAAPPPVEAAPAGISCPNCKKPVPEGVKFCLNCGKPVGPVATATPIPTPVPTSTHTDTNTPVPTPTPVPARVAAAPAGDSAKDHYEKGVKYYGQGNKLGAVMEFTKVSDIDPNYKDVQKWIGKINEEMLAPKPAAAGPNPQQQKVIESHLRLGMDHYSKSEYKKAVAEFKIVLEVVESHAQAAKLLGEAETKMKDSLGKSLAAARRHRDRGELSKEMLAWRSALRIDDENEEARRELSAAQAKAPEEANRLYRLGLDLYAAGKIEDAIDSWKGVIELDPNHDRAETALQKAERKMEEIKAGKVGQ